MTPIRTFSPTMYWIMMIVGFAIFAGVTIFGWTSDTDEVGLALSAKLKMTAAAVVIGGGIMAFARKYKRDAELEAAEAEMVRRNLGMR